MIKSNSNKFKEKVNKYILECIDIYEEHATNHEALLAVVNRWNSYHSNRRDTSIQHEFINFLRALAINIDFETHKQRELLMLWYEQNKTTAAKYDNMHIDNTFYYQVFKGFERLFKRHDIIFL